MNKTWENVEVDFIKANAHKMKDKEIVVEISKMRRKPISLTAVRKKRAEMGLKKMSGRGICELRKKEGGFSL